MIRTVVETFIRLVKDQLNPDAVLVPSDDIFEVPKVPSLILQGPTMIENKGRRTFASLIHKDIPNLMYEEYNAPRLYHLDFDLIVTEGHAGDLINMQEKVTRFYLFNPIIKIGDEDYLNLTELVSMGSLRRVNLSNLKQSSGRCRIEDCPVYDGKKITGKLIKTSKFEYQDKEESK